MQVAGILQNELNIASVHPLSWEMNILKIINSSLTLLILICLYKCYWHVVLEHRIEVRPAAPAPAPRSPRASREAFPSSAARLPRTAKRGLEASFPVRRAGRQTLRGTRAGVDRGQPRALPRGDARARREGRAKEPHRHDPLLTSGCGHILRAPRVSGGRGNAPRLCGSADGWKRAGVPCVCAVYMFRGHQTHARHATSP